MNNPCYKPTSASHLVTWMGLEKASKFECLIQFPTLGIKSLNLHTFLWEVISKTRALSLMSDSKHLETLKVLGRSGLVLSLFSVFGTPHQGKRPKRGGETMFPQQYSLVSQALMSARPRPADWQLCVDFYSSAFNNGTYPPYLLNG